MGDPVPRAQQFLKICNGSFPCFSTLGEKKVPAGAELDVILPRFWTQAWTQTRRYRAK
jgi:hypothetical protein